MKVSISYLVQTKTKMVIA